ncbi:phosphoribosylanthranilate isomerase [Stackebrandtia endophytica]|uniref:N-(5'-phosphoribosyl)anthranilate isomerase n=1 Tax=Stackebrandtia endophytica TaxID=1496996 RepID=A0A543B1C7_9ACTN|nr:phosphoribosylanthranilate isomerase [Stackebrandtia endophytica]TQL78624.1 phosphoribosylanthranilate isomerase [Stackebrandtia endophytica]
MFVKICGLRSVEHVEAAVAAGADAIGFLLSRSPRQVTPSEAAVLAATVPDHVLSVGVFATETTEQIRRDAEAAGVDTIQLHGAYKHEDFQALADLPVKLIRAIAGAEDPNTDCGAYGEDLLIVDAAKPGSGEPWDWTRLPAEPTGHWLLAGGLSPDNVACAVAEARPWGVDVSSGVEVSRGMKDPGLIRDFITAAKQAG